MKTNVPNPMFNHFGFDYNSNVAIGITVLHHCKCGEKVTSSF